MSNQPNNAAHEALAEHRAETQQKHYEADIRDILPLPEQYGGNIRPKEEYFASEADLHEFAMNLKENGVITPLECFRNPDNKEQWFLVDGHRRYTAAMYLLEKYGIALRVKIIAVDLRKLSNEEMVVRMVVHATGKSLSPLALSEAVRRLEAHKWEASEIARRFGWLHEDGQPKTYLVKNLSLLGSAPKRVREYVRAGVIPYTLTLDMLKDAKDFNVAIENIERAIDLARGKVAEKIARKKGLDDTNAVTDDMIHAEGGKVRVTRSTYEQAMNRVNSYNELKRFMKNQLDEYNPILPANAGIYNFVKDILENKLTLADIERKLLLPKANQQ